MARINIFFIHGFLGRPSDWTSVRSLLPMNEKIRYFTPDYFKDPLLGPHISFANWSKNFTALVEKNTRPGDRNVIIGYSLGGRLALHALEEKPSLWHKVMILSTNPGFDDLLPGLDPASELRRGRWMTDTYWADEFLTKPWDMVIRNWNNQPVFGGGENEPVRNEKDYSRESLSLALTQWSLAQQKNMRPLIAAHIDKVICLVGAKDEKYMEQAEALKEQIPNLNKIVIESSSHRIPFENPRHLSRAIIQLIQQLLQGL